MGILLAAANLDAKVFHVDGHSPDEHPSGESWASAFSSVQEAIGVAHTNGGGEIWVKAGVYKPTGDGRAATFRLDSKVELYGGFRGTETDLAQRNPKANRTVLSGDIGRIGSRSDNCHHVVTGASNSRIDGFIVMAGSADGEGEDGRGGALLLGGAVKEFTVANCVFEKNNARSGGAIHSLANGVALTNCTFFSNSADSGGAFVAGAGTRTRINDSIFSSNYSKQSGGAVAMGSGTEARFSGCSFQFNSTEGAGGAVAASTGRKDGIRLEFLECTFSDNSAQGTGGAVACRGPFAPVLSKCRFLQNLSTKGVGTVASLDGAVASLTGCTFSRNQGAKGVEDIRNDPAPVVAKAAPKPKPVPKKKRTLADVFVHDGSGAKVGLRGMVGEAGLTVLVLGDLTDPGFISSYRGVEAAALDYAGKGVNFFYIYRYLAHPENNGYLQPFNLRERARQVSAAANLLHTRVPWLCDTMDNQVAGALEQEDNNLFIFNRDGLEEYAGHSKDEPALRSALGKLAGTATPSVSQPIALPNLKPVDMPRDKGGKRVKINPLREKYLPLKITPLGSRSPFYVKLRVEANEALLKTGDGRLYLGFHIDPIYKVEWNNLRKTVSYAMTVPRGTVISPSINEARRVSAQAIDSDPREFLLEARNWNNAQPVSITVNYSVRGSSPFRSYEIKQQYLIYLEQDRFGGAVFGRQIPMPTK